MAPSRIMFIRHAEKPHKPPCDNDDGVKKTGEKDNESLTVRGWQRAGALVHFFSPRSNLSRRKRSLRPASVTKARAIAPGKQ
jgi:hypothetical protein